ncbi:hypothetical protein LguiB_011154 [Lonicera macranthoides]
MKSTSQLIPFTTATILVLLLVVPSSNAAITCSVVVKYMNPCVNYLKSGSGLPPSACCSGATTLFAAVTTTADKQTACNCLKTVSKSTSVNVQLAKALPGNCGISLSFSISPTVDCSKIT